MTGTRTVVLGAVLVATACGGTTTPATNLTATLNVVLSDDPNVKVASADGSVASLAHHKVFGQNYFHAQLTGAHQVAISRNGRDWTPLGAPTQIDLALQTEGEAFELHADTQVPAGTYSFLRLTTVAAVARLESGGEVAGEPLADPVSLSLGSGTLVIETRLSTPIFLAPGSEVTLAVDLNTEAWMSEENLAAGQIPATDIETAISVTPHERLPVLIVPLPERRI